MQEVFEKIVEKLEEENRRLKSLKNDCIALSDSEVNAIENKAYNFAIEIVQELAEEYKGMYVSKKEVEYMLDTIEMRGDETWMDYYRKALKGLCELTVEEKNNGWIPCSERLPEESGYYLTWVNYDGDEFANIDEIDCDGVLKEWNCMEDYEIIAWQPLPEHYQPKGE